MDSYQHLNSKVTCLGSYFEFYIKDLDIVKDKLIIKYVIKSTYDEPLLIWNTGIIIGSKKIDTMNFICDLVRYNDFESTIEVEIPNVDKEYAKYASEEVILLLQIDEDENTVENIEVTFDFNLFLSKEGKRQLSDIQNAINFPNKISGVVTLINRPIPFIKNWEDVLARYSALDKHSRNTKKLAEWGLVLSSAFLLNPIEANKMWQEVIDCNIKESSDFLIYFLNQIFHKIRDNLRIKYAAEFLFMDFKRVKLMCESHDEKNCVIGYCLENNDIDLAVRLLRKYSEHNEDYTDIKLYFYNDASQYLKEYSSVPISNANTYRNVTIDIFYKFMKTTSSLLSLNTLNAFADIFKLVCDQQVLDDANLAQTYIDLIFKEYEFLLTKGKWYERSLLGLLSKFIYLERNILDYNLNIKKLCSYSPEFLKHIENYYLFNEEEYKWYFEYVKNNKYMQHLLFTSKTGRISSYEETYLNELAQNSNWDVFLEYVTLIINSGDDTRARSCFSYLDSAVKECCSTMQIHNHTIGFLKLTVTTKQVFSEAFKDFEEVNIVKLYNTLLKLFWNIEQLKRKKQLFEIIQYFYNEFAKNLNNVVSIQQIKEFIEKNKEDVIEIETKNTPSVELKSENAIDILFNYLLKCSRYKVKTNKFTKHQIVYDCFEEITKNVLLKMQSDLRQKKIVLGNYIIDGQKPQRVYIVTSEGAIIRETTMICCSADTLFCEYLIRIIEYYMRSKVDYVTGKRPLPPVSNDYNAIYYCHNNGNKGYYRLVDLTKQKSIIKDYDNIFNDIESIILNEVNTYFLENNSLFQEIISIIKSNK